MVNSIFGPSNENEDFTKYILWYWGNPFARIKCRSFERICTWVCISCKKERDEFRAQKIEAWKKYFRDQEIQSGGDPYDENIWTLLKTQDPERMVQNEIDYLSNQKWIIFLWQHTLPQGIKLATSGLVGSNPLH